MPSPVTSGQEIMVPLFNAESAGAPVHVSWQQNLSQRTADYYALTADNITTGEQVPFFIAAEYYKSSTKANPNHITKIGELVEGGKAAEMAKAFGVGAAGDQIMNQVKAFVGDYLHTF
ncbi:hypothetical protein MVEN_00883400 [Mycena venus]|uniref:Uncharacterized protein n=1 Tax=Mycena venus TaxID=2733690 RepID=A0A8H6YC42_9AGAR|nr:hypothetical protein MVEN_00883400 [Mycena venus]